MTESPERVCAVCARDAESIQLERCAICQRYFCNDCAHKGFGRKFCSPDCARSYYFTGETDDDENLDHE